MRFIDYNFSPATDNDWNKDSDVDQSVVEVPDDNDVNDDDDEDGLKVNKVTMLPPTSAAIPKDDNGNKFHRYR